MRSVLFFIFCMLSIGLFAQAPRGANRGGQGMNTTGRFYGKIVDESTNKGIEAASVLLIQSKTDSASGQKKDVTIAGQLTTSKGEFSLENLPAMGQFRLAVTAIGYTPLEQTIKFDARNLDKDLGNLKLEADIQQLGEVTVVATKPMFQMGVDRKIFNVDKNITTTGQTATATMQMIRTPRSMAMLPCATQRLLYL